MLFYLFFNFIIPTFAIQTKTIKTIITMRVDFKKVGVIKIHNADGQVMVSDPSFDSLSFASTIVSGLMDGTYNCIIGVANLEGWGKRVTKLIIVHEDKNIMDLVNPIHHAVVGVDSGTMCISDIDYYDKYHTGEVKNREKEDDWYNKYVCGMTKFSHTVRNKCVISRSGLGDGGYNVNRYENEYNEVFGVDVTFIEY